MKFINILEVLEQELERRIERSKENYNLFCEQEKINKKLKAENEMLRKDLAELSKEHFKK
ncbi:MAG: hypothetical protein ACK53Y_27510 [bacterium]|jgi:hypothetical protein